VSFMMKVFLSMAVSIAVVVAVAWFASPAVEALGAIVVATAGFAFTRALMSFAAEPGQSTGERRRRMGRRAGPVGQHRGSPGGRRPPQR
jgi:hypothetical protein